MIESSSNIPPRVFEEQPTSCCRITCNELLALVTSTALGALVGIAICFAISNPVGAVVGAIILSGVLAADLICSIALFANRLFRGSIADRALPEDKVKLDISQITENSSLEESEETSLDSISEVLQDSEESVSVTENEEVVSSLTNQSEEQINDSKNSLSDEQITLLLALTEHTSPPFVIRCRYRNDEKAEKFLETYGLNSKSKSLKNYSDWRYIWASDLIPRHPYFLNSRPIIDFKNGNIVKGFFYNECPFIAFQLNCVTSIDEKREDAMPRAFILYETCSDSKNEFLLIETDLRGNLLNNYPIQQLRSIIQDNIIVGYHLSGESDVSTESGESYVSDNSDRSREQ